ncbi:MAG: sigma-70 family RNA polymerase sigma factor [Ferruginibacter sp.]
MAFIKNISGSNQTDAELVQAYKDSGNMQPLSMLYQRYMELLYGVCLKYLEDADAAKDAVIDIFEQLVTKLHKHEVANFKAWVYQLAKNHCLMKLRSGKKFIKSQTDPELMQNAEILHLNGELEKEDNFRMLEYCLGQLPEEQKKVVELFYLQEKCYNDIVSATGIEWNKVRSYIQNGRRNLKICMDKQLNAV